MANNTPQHNEFSTPKILISDKEIREQFGISAPTLYRWTVERGFPGHVEGVRGRRSYKQVMNWAKEQGWT